MPLNIRDPGSLPNVFARVEDARALLGRSLDQRDPQQAVKDIDEQLRTIVRSLVALAATQHELNKRLWESNKGLPAPHAETHIHGDDALGGDLGDGNLVGINVKTVTVDYTFESDVWLVRGDASGGALTVTLPPASDRPGRLVAVSKVDDTVNPVTIAPSSGNMLAEESGSFDLVLQSEVLSLISNGSDWTVV